MAQASAAVPSLFRLSLFRFALSRIPSSGGACSRHPSGGRGPGADRGRPSRASLSCAWTFSASRIFLVIFFSSLVSVVVGLLRALGSGRGLLPFRQRLCLVA